MKNSMKKIVAAIMAFAMLFVACIPVYAVEAENEEETLKERIHHYAMARFDANVRRWMENSQKVESEYVTVEEAIQRFSKELGYVPEYKEWQWYPTRWSLTITLKHSPNDTMWDCEITNLDDNGWRMERRAFEDMINEMKAMYLTVPEEYEGDEKLYTTKEIETLFLEKYGYPISVYMCDYWSERGIEVEFIICDSYNGLEKGIRAIYKDGEWYVTEDEWYQFIRRFDFTAEAEYATENVKFLTCQEIIDILNDMFGYLPEVEVIKEKNNYVIDFSFEHLRGAWYSIYWVLVDENENLLVTEKVFEKFITKIQREERYFN